MSLTPRSARNPDGRLIRSSFIDAGGTPTTADTLLALGWVAFSVIKRSADDDTGFVTAVMHRAASRGLPTPPASDEAPLKALFRMAASPLAEKASQVAGASGLLGPQVKKTSMRVKVIAVRPTTSGLFAAMRSRSSS